MSRDLTHRQEIRMSWTALGSMVATITVTGSMVAGLAAASPPMIAKAKQKGYPAQNCQYCHVSNLPKKETFKPDDLNDRGKWLAAEKDKQKAKEIDVDWLKDYPGGKEQK
jgi:hypothetical protein